MEPPIKDPSEKKINRNNLSTKDTPKCSFSHIVNTFRASEESGQPLYKGQNGWPQSVLYWRFLCTCVSSTDFFLFFFLYHYYYYYYFILTTRLFSCFNACTLSSIDFIKLLKSAFLFLNLFTSSSNSFFPLLSVSLPCTNFLR